MTSRSTSTSAPEKTSTICELAELVRAVVFPEAELVFDTSKPDGTPRKLLDVSRLEALGWSPRIGLEGRCREHISVVRQERGASELATFSPPRRPYKDVRVRTRSQGSRPGEIRGGRRPWAIARSMVKPVGLGAWQLDHSPAPGCLGCRGPSALVGHQLRAFAASLGSTARAGRLRGVLPRVSRVVRRPRSPQKRVDAALHARRRIHRWSRVAGRHQPRKRGGRGWRGRVRGRLRYHRCSRRDFVKSRAALVAVAVLAPDWRSSGVLARRLHSLRSGRERPPANDLFWAVGQVVAFGFVLTSGRVTVAGGVLAWGAGAWLAAGIGSCSSP